MPIIPSGSSNLSSLNVPDVYVNIIPPNPLLNGVPSNIMGVVGTATWGPVNSPVYFSGLNQGLTAFGNPQNEDYDLTTPIYLANLQNASSFVAVRVTDGTDTNAIGPILDSNATTLAGARLKAKYTGTLGNNLIATLARGSNYTTAVPTYRISISLPGGIPEVFDNIGGSGAAFWTNLISAINNGQGAFRGPSNLVTAIASDEIGYITITNAGSGYSSAPAVGFTGGDGSGAAATAVLGFGLNTITIGTAGSYQSIPSVAITQASGHVTGSGAVLASPLMKVVGYEVADAGTDYDVGDVLTAVGGTHSVAATLTIATAVLTEISINAAGTGYAVNDTITLSGGTSTVKAVLTVTTVGGGGTVTGVSISTPGSYTVTATTFTQFSTSGSGTGATFNNAAFGVGTVTISNVGSYSALPTDPVATTSTPGSGATFNLDWGILSIAVSSAGSLYIPAHTSLTISGGGGTGGAATINFLSTGGVAEVNMTAYGSNYTIVPTVGFSGGSGSGAAATAVLGSNLAPALNLAVAFSGGTNGNSGVSSTTLIGVDGTLGNRTGMYALRGSQASVIMLSNAYDSAKWIEQQNFGITENVYMIATAQGGQYSDIAAAITLKNSVGVQNYNFKLLLGDWVQFNDPFNNITRLVSEQGFICGILASLLPSESSLNKPLNAIISTQASNAGLIYSIDDLSELKTAGIDLIARPIPANAASFGGRLGVNTSGNNLTNGDNYPRMINFLAKTFEVGLGDFIGKAQSPDVQREARNTLQSFLSGLQALGVIGTSNGSPAFSVILDDSNNPPDRVAEGYMQANVQVTLLSIIQYFVINLQAGQSVQVQVLPPQLALAA